MVQLKSSANSHSHLLPFAAPQKSAFYKKNNVIISQYQIRMSWFHNGHIIGHAGHRYSRTRRHNGDIF